MPPDWAWSNLVGSAGTGGIRAGPFLTGGCMSLIPVRGCGLSGSVSLGLQREEAGGIRKGAMNRELTNTKSLLQGSPSHSVSYSRLTGNPQDQHVSSEVAVGGSACSEWHPLPPGNVSLD